MHQGAIAKLSKFTVEYYYCFPTLSCTLFLEFGGSGASNLVYHQASPDDLDSEYEMPLPPRQPFQLPSTVTILFREEKDGRVSAHALDFDLVSTDANRELAMKKIRLAITSYVETGLVNEWADDIRFPAPERYWPEPGAQLEVGDPITILSRNLLVYSASSIANEHREAHSLA